MIKRTRGTTAASSKGSKRTRLIQQRLTCWFHGRFWNGTTTNTETIAVLVNNRDDAFHYDAKTSRCRWCDKQWQEFLKRNRFRVPEQVPTIEDAMRIGFNLSKQTTFFPSLKHSAASLPTPSPLSPSFLLQTTIHSFQQAQLTPPFCT